MHEIENMFTVGEAPWHKLGTNLRQSPEIAAGLRLAGLDWRVRLEPVFLGDGTRAPAMATVRDSDQRLLGVVGSRFRPLQNEDAFAFFEPLIGTNEVELESAGSLRNGQRVWVLARIRRDPIAIVPAAADVVAPYLLVANGHDGTMSLRVGFTAIRVVCANTLAMATEPRMSKLLRIRHHARAAETLATVRGTIDLAMRQFSASADNYRLLAQRQVNPDDLRRYIVDVLRPQTGDADLSGRATERLVDKISTHFTEGRGNKHRAVAGTWWAAFNAITEHPSHERGRCADNRLDGLWFGDAAQINRRALRLAVEMAA